MRSFAFYCLLLLILFLIASGCRSSSSLSADEMTFHRSDITPEELVSMVPDYSEQLHSIQGDGRAIVSEPGNSERVSVRFFSSREESLIFVRNSAGIEGGQIYLDTDSLTIYNRVDRIAEKVPLNRSDRSSVGSLASLNLLKLFNYSVSSHDLSEIFENEYYFQAVTFDDALITISKRNGTVVSVAHANNDPNAPYSRIEYEGYSLHDSFFLPGRITVTGSDEKSRVTLMVRRLEVNNQLPDLELTIPENVPLLRL